MKKFPLLVIGFLIVGVLVGVGVFAAKTNAGWDFSLFGDNPDMPSFLNKESEDNDKDSNVAASGLSEEEYLLKRSEAVAEKRGIEKDKPFNPQNRINAIRKMETQEAKLLSRPSSPEKSAILSAWTEIGPNPIPNGQVQSGSQLPVSGRTTAIAVHPTNANIVYVGTAQGGLYRTTDGGTTWTPLMDNALSLAIGAVAIAPSQPDTVYVGTGEPNFSADSFFGVGVYRIDNASTASPTLTGPIGGTQFAGRAIGEIIVHPTIPATIFVASTSGIGGIIAASTSPLPNRGVYRSTDATSASPTFTQIGVPTAATNVSVRDIAIDPNDPNILIANSIINTTGGIMRTTNALAATPTWTQAFAFTTGTSTSNLTAEFAVVHPAGDANATFYAAVGNNAAGTGTGRMLKSTDGGATFTQTNTTAFCGGQCFYNIAIDVDPTNVNNVYWGGTGTSTFRKSTDGGTTSVTSNNNLHTDTHAIAVAPSLPSTIYFGSDGGIYKSTDSGTTWASLNNTTFRATQFMSVDVHSTDSNFTLGGTQDNGTEYRNPAGAWIRQDGGDGGYCAIDQSTSSTSTVNLYHTYFNAPTQTGYGFAPDLVSGFSFRGCLGSVANGITCTATINFYAPLERGPGTPNSIYYGADRLYRTADTGVTHATISQTFTSPISAIGISPQNDNVRIIGQNNGGIFGTGTSPGTTTLQDLDPTNAVPNSPIARAIIDPNNVNTAYVTLSAFNVVNVWKTTSLGSFANNLSPTWTAAAGSGGTALPQVPVNAFIVDPLNSNKIYAGTDIGVYFSVDGGTSWNPFGTGLPRVAVFDMAITPNRTMRIATHGRGMWDIPLLAPTASTASIRGRVVTPNARGLLNAIVSITNTTNGEVLTARTTSLGYFNFTDLQVGETYIVRVRSKRYLFNDHTFTLNEDLDDLVLTGY